jgi:hypothetical protein
LIQEFSKFSEFLPIDFYISGLAWVLGVFPFTSDSGSHVRAGWCYISQVDQDMGARNADFQLFEAKLCPTTARL